MSKKINLEADFEEYDCFVWGSIDPRIGEMNIYPSKESNLIENMYVSYLSNPENNKISLPDYHNITIHFDNDYFIQKTQGGLRSVFRIEKEKGNKVIEVLTEFNKHYKSWYLKIPKTTHIGLLVDTSGSMYNSYSIIIEKCVEEFIEKQKSEIENKSLFYGMTFSDKLNMIYDGVNLKEQTDIRETFYSIKPEGLTAYHDAYIEMIKKIESKYKLNDEVIICCMTDGQDNSSKYSKNYLRKVITDCKHKGWLFVMFGTKEADLDNIDIGLNKNECLEIGLSPCETASAYKCLNDNITSVRKGQSHNIEFSDVQRGQSNNNF